MQIVYRDTQMQVEAYGLEDDETPFLELRSVCLGCGAVLQVRDLSWAVREHLDVEALMRAAQEAADLDRKAIDQHECPSDERG
jgi:hypothetical protein